jgi:sulfur-oxidizing protein SoxY
MSRIGVWLLTGALGLLCATAGDAQMLRADDDPRLSPVWLKVRASLFESRAIEPAPAGLLTLEMPARAVDSAVVPVALRSSLPTSGPGRISKLYLIIDANPSPISAIFQFTPDSGRAELETRVRVEAYTHVRAIAETSDGKLFMTTRFVKASGGCSAPAGADAAAAQAALGQMRFRVEGEIKGTQPVRVQLMIEHPNHSGLAMDQLTRQYTPAHYVRHVEINYANRPLLTADVDFSISENPTFYFYLLPRGGGELRATVLDSHDMRFVATQTLQ